MPKAVEKITTVCEICATSFDRTPAFHRSAEAKGGKVRFCGMKCFGEAKRTGVVKISNPKGKLDFTCEICGEHFQRWPSSVRYAEKTGQGVRFCSQKCHGLARTARVILMPIGTKEINRKRSDRNRAAWGLPPHSPAVMQLSKGQRAMIARGVGFNASQLRKWLDTGCCRCGATEKLELDHILCMAAGGKSVRSNAQTLCRPCNRWKIKHIDRPLVHQQSQSGGAQ